MKEKLLIILGPTSVGKTDLSIDIAKKFDGEIISGDSMQVYKQMDIGTAKIKKQEMMGIPHYLIDCFDPDYYFSAADFKEIAIEKITTINQKGHLPIIAGGTGLYIKSVIQQYQFSIASKDETYREEMNRIAEEKGNKALHDRLASIDMTSAEKLHINDRKRVIRALEVHHLTGKKMSEVLEEQKLETPYDLLMIGLTMDRAKLYDRINRRVEYMLEQGLIDEVKKLLKLGYNEQYHAMQAIGYKEILQYVRGEISLDRAIYMIKQGTRRFAKRQLSLFRQLQDIQWFDVTTVDINERNKIYHNIYHLIAGKFPHLQNK